MKSSLNTYFPLCLALRDAVRMRDSQEIHRMVHIINNNPLYLYHLQHDAIEAERIADEVDRVMWYKRTVLHMDKKVNSKHLQREGKANLFTSLLLTQICFALHLGVTKYFIILLNAS